MLTSLNIKDFLLIKDIEIFFEKNFTVITGETGAGKSIILSALMLVLGDKLNGRKVTNLNSSETATIIAHFDLKNNSEAQNFINNLAIPLNDLIIIRRHIYSDGRSKIFINDIAVSIQTVCNFREYILEISGQHSSRGLLEISTHLNLLDEYSNNTTILTELSNLYTNFKNNKLSLENLLIRKEKSEIEKDFLKNIINELTSLNIKENEEDLLIEARSKIADKYRISEVINKINQRLSQLDYHNHFYAIHKELERCGDLFDVALQALNNAISEMKEFEAQVEEIADKYSENLNMEQIESRLFKIRTIARKYSVLTNELNNLLSIRKAELEEIDNLDYLIQKMNQELLFTKKAYYDLAEIISQNRMKGAENLKHKIESILKDLMMEKVEIQINVEKFSDLSKWGPKGINKIEFLVQTNPGLGFTNIAKCASGGELSRIMLAIKLALSEKTSINIVVFDEIDVGISGAVASAVGKKLSELAKSCQVIAVTHQSQVAAYANNHLHVSKTSDDETTLLNISSLGAKESLNELARMISGKKVTKESLAAAKSLMNESKV